MSTIFSKIVKGELPAYKVAEDDRFLAFLDINPLAKGHTLVVPKKQQNIIFNLTKPDCLTVMDFSYKVAKALEKAVPCKRIGMSVVVLEVPHVHVHLIPTSIMADMQFTKKEKLTNEEFVELAESISENFE